MGESKGIKFTISSNGVSKTKKFDMILQITSMIEIITQYHKYHRVGGLITISFGESNRDIDTKTLKSNMQ
ncbi:MAG TPA: hypothetical protein VFI64_03035 [Nitrososphaeraceae archaeon]|nr:hypothetical protein [Nitrososphaeraceae archaeon]